MKYCQGPKCHEYHTKDRIRGPKGDKHYETRKRTSFYYLGGNACSMQCERDWYNAFGALALGPPRFARWTSYLDPIEVPTPIPINFEHGTSIPF